jgi:hypothetical protein
MENANLTKRQQFWLNHYQICIDNGKSYEAYCREHDLSGPAFAHARKTLIKRGVIKSKEKYYKHNSVSKFVSVKTTSAPPISIQESAELRLPNGIKIQIPLHLINNLLISLSQGGISD